MKKVNSIERIIQLMRDGDTSATKQNKTDDEYSNLLLMLLSDFFKLEEVSRMIAKARLSQDAITEDFVSKHDGIIKVLDDINEELADTVKAYSILKQNQYILAAAIVHSVNVCMCLPDAIHHPLFSHYAQFTIKTFFNMDFYR